MQQAASRPLQHPRTHRAARAEHVTPSSLSRSLGLLEEHLGRKLLDRVGRNVKLNAEGETLLAAVRDAMRRIDDAGRRCRVSSIWRATAISRSILHGAPPRG